VKILSRLLPPSFDPLKVAVFSLCAWAGTLASCSQNPVTVNLHAMQSSGRVSFVCRGADNDSKGHKLDECPEYESATRHTMALVTQTATNEVAVVDLYAQTIVDIDQTTPGYSFLRVGGAPGAIVTTPGGAATFVGVTDLQKNGIFAIPTSCILPPRPAEPGRPADPPRDLTTWQACHLSSAPGDITVVIDPKMVPVMDPAMAPGAPTKMAPRESCGSMSPTTDPKLDPICPADVAHEPGPVGRRKLLVALPDEHKLVLLDAQRLLDQKAGDFPECELEATYPLNGDVPASDLTPELPDDLKPPSMNSCEMVTYPAQHVSAAATPGGFAAAADSVYIADLTRPVIHVLDVKDPCKAKELEPLLPRSYNEPNRLVTTSRVAVSPPTRQGNQFLYAIDQNDQPSASVMAFDLGKIASNPDNDNLRTPLIVKNFPRTPVMRAPDRLRFPAPVRDVSFVMRDFPKADPETGAGEYGLSCNPDPNASTPDTLYQPNADYSDGARPINLRGLFGFAMLTNGQVAVIDVEDFDAPCRRPVTTNPAKDEDLHGCPGGEPSSPYKRGDGVRTVTDESSCNIVEPNRPRSAPLSISSTSNGLHAPTLRTFPQFSTPGTSVPLDNQPRVIATDFPNDVAQVNVNSQIYANCSAMDASQKPPCDVTTTTQLNIQPRGPAVQNSLSLPLVEPRSYAQDESPTLVFEGQLFPPRASGYFEQAPDTAQWNLVDPDANFCGVGVEDSDTIAESGTKLRISQSALPAWSKNHADYVQITGDYLLFDDPYWSKGRGNLCASVIDPTKPDADDRDACIRKFGPVDDLTKLYPERELSIIEASSGKLLVQPRSCDNGACNTTMEQITCCFPTATAYTVRASNQWLLTGTSGFGLHDMAAESPGGRCVHTASCDPSKKYFGQRAFEVCDPTDPTCKKDDPTVGCVGQVGKPPYPSDMNALLPVEPGGPGSECIFENLTSRFVVYRGAEPSRVGMAFSWQTTGGFVPQTMTLLTQSSSVSPQSLGYLPELGYLAVVDASTLGLVLFDLNSLAIVSPSPYF